MWKHLKPLLFSRTLLLILLRRHNYNVFFVHENVFIAFLTNQNSHWTNSRGGTPILVTGTYPPPSYPPSSPPPPNHQATTREKFPAVTFYKYQMEGQLRIRGVVFDRVSHQFSQQLQHNVILLIDNQNRLPKTYAEILYTFCLENGLQMNLSVRSKYLIILNLCWNPLCNTFLDMRK